MDGSFLSKPLDYHASNDSDKIINLNWKEDPTLSDRTLSDAVSVISKEGIWDLVERGRKHAIVMEKRGDFDCLIL
jgi:hypothetical protein